MSFCARTRLSRDAVRFHERWLAAPSSPQGAIPDEWLQRWRQPEQACQELTSG